MYARAGKETKRLSFTFILTITPAIISNARPRDEIIKMILNFTPLTNLERLKPPTL